VSNVLRSGLTVSLSHCLLTVALSHSLFVSWCGLVVHPLRQLVRLLVRVLVRLLVPLQVGVLVCGRGRVRGTSSRERGTRLVPTSSPIVARVVERG